MFVFFFSLVLLSLLTPLLVASGLQYPFITGKAFFFRIVIELALPFYLYLICARAELRPRFKGNILNIAVLIFLGINFLSALLGVNVHRSLWGNFERMGGVYFLAHLTALFFYIQLLGQAGEKYVKRFLQSFIAIATLIALNGLSGWFHGPMLSIDPNLPGRASSTLGNPIYFAGYLLIPFFLALSLAWKEKKTWLKRTYIASALLHLFGIYIAGSRGVEMGMLFGIFIAVLSFIFLVQDRKIAYRVFALLFFTVIVSGLLFKFHDRFDPDSVLYRMTNLSGDTTSSRWIQWKMALSGYPERPFFGTGPENYYIIANAHFNPEMYKYDPSWFDKPHNSLIESLVTTGLFGFLAYVFVFFSSFFLVWKTWKQNLISLMDFCVSLAILFTYHVQNLFVFDSIITSITYFIFLGYIATRRTVEPVQKEKNIKTQNNDSKFSIGVFFISSLFVLIALIVTNFNSWNVARLIVLGSSSQDPYKAARYYEKAISTPYNLDAGESASPYNNFLTLLIKSGYETKDAAFVKKHIDQATENQKKVTERIGNDPKMWIALAGDFMLQSYVQQKDYQNAEDAIRQAINLAPGRIEPLQLQFQLAMIKKDYAQGLEVAKQIYALDTRNQSHELQLASAYYLNGQMEEGVKIVDAVLDTGLKTLNYFQYGLFIRHFETKKEFKKNQRLLEAVIALRPNNREPYILLAKTYGALGMNDQAKEIVRLVQQADPSYKAEGEKFIQSLK